MRINRRTFLNASLASLTVAAMPKALAMGQESFKSEFQKALLNKPFLSGYQSAAQTSYQGKVSLKGKLPKALQGTLFRNGPAQHEIGDFRYQHWFDGDGMIHAYQLGDGALNHRSRMIETTKYKAEQAEGRAMYPGFGTIPENPGALTSPDLVNVGNISVLPHHGKLLALWEAGSPWEIDPDSLKTEGLYQFSDDTRGVPFSAHPRVEPDGTLWNFGYVSGANLIVFWHIDKNGKIVKMGKVKSDPISMPHDFVVTKNHIVMLMPPLNYSRSNRHGAFLDVHNWQPEQSTRVLVVDKSDFNQHRWLELPSQWVFHFGNAFEDKNGVIQFDGARASDPSVMTENFRAIMRGEVLKPEPSHLYQYRIDTKSWLVSEESVLPDTIDAEFPTIDPRVSTEQHKNLVFMSSDIKSPAVHQNLNQVSRFNYQSGELTSFRYPDSQIPEEHLFVPAANSRPESKGWVLGTAHDWQKAETVLNIFDYEAVDAGPIASATLPYGMPLGLHGKFVSG